MSACPVCGGARWVESVRRERLPVLQNRVYADEREARASPTGAFTLAVCERCGFARNARFDPSRLSYDGSYDNDVPSAVFHAYYEQLAAHLARRYGLGDGLVVDIGCGQGHFLTTLCETVPGLRGLGFDPACEPASGRLGGRLTLQRDVLRAGVLAERPVLLLCRHVLEHIADPVDFLRCLRAGAAGWEGVPLFVEVPDTGWILRAGAFWDFCYEHCNYFTSDSLAGALAAAGFVPGAATAAFGGQYLWIEAVVGAPGGGDGAPRPTPRSAGAALVEASQAYARRESELLARARGQIEAARARREAVIVWGMATKGVVFAHLVDPERRLLDACIDINPRKQGRCAPGTGHRIDAPEALRAFRGRTCRVLVMNPNYAAEIGSQCAALGLDAALVDAAGAPLA